MPDLSKIDGDFQSLFYFLKGALEDHRVAIENIRKYRNKVIAHNDRKADELLKEQRDDKEYVRWEQI